MFGKRLSRALAVTAALAVMAATAVSAAELATAEVDGTANSVDVTAGAAAANFAIKLTASGAIDCDFTAAAPSTARVHTVYSLSFDGTDVAVSSNTFGSSFDFFSNGNPTGGSGNCGVTWTGAPTPYSQAASVTAAANVPAGSYTIDLEEANSNTETTNATGSAKLDDNIATTLTFVVSEPVGCTDPIEYSAKFLQPLDGSTPNSLVKNTVKRGRVVPIKVELFSYDPCTDVTTELKGGTVTINLSTVASTGSSDAVESFSDAGAANNDTNQFRWDGSGDFWIYNYDTSVLVANSSKRIDIYRDGTQMTSANWATIAITK